MARPKKYNTDLLIKSVAIPRDLLDYLNDLKDEYSLSFNELIINMLISSDKKLSEQTISKIEQLKHIIIQHNKQNQELTKQLNETKKFTVSNMFSKLGHNKELDDFLSKYKKKLKQIYNPGNINKDDFIKVIYNKFEDHMLLNNQTITKKRLITKLIRKFVLEELK